jgi:flagellar basal body-associated protein FliL
MADKSEKKSESAPPAPAQGAAGAGAAKKAGVGGMLTKMPVMLGGVMILEAVVLFAGFKFLGSGPKTAAAGVVLEENEEGHGKEKGEHGAGGGAGTASSKQKTVELQVLDFKAQNKLSGRTFIYDVSVYIVTRSDFEQKAKDTIKAREALIKDRVRTIIAQNDPEKLGGGSEPGLETLRRQVKHQLDEILGEGLIEEVLVPRCIPFRTDF